MLSPLKLTPNMPIETMVDAINQNFRQIEAENRTKVIKDEDGNNRIIIGRAPNGEYIVAISANEYDVLEVIGE